MIVGRQIEHGGRTLQVLECQVTQRTSQPFTTNAGGYMIGNVVNPPTTTTRVDLRTRATASSAT